ncbi:U3 small nucleolar RNA-associated protein 18 [Entomortierella beljakovae]|nr:U3 small nucleolar RNA-associated protein 18 [Entomortierella beljakovae]
MAPKSKKSKVAHSGAGAGKKDVRPITHMTESRHQKKGFVTASEENEQTKPKEKSEIELENLIFGDNEELIGETFARAGHELSSDEEADAMDEFDYEAEEGEELAGSDMFFIDEGPTPLERDEIDEDAEELHQDEEDEEVDDEGDGDDEEEEDDEEEDEEESRSNSELARLKLMYGGKPAWTDKDDQALTVSLKSANRLKKLRKEEQEDVVNGVDYEQRLRKQFEKVYPVPSWAMPNKKRRRGVLGGDSDSEYSDEEQEQEDNSILMSSKGFLEKSARLKTLPSESISVTRVKNANQNGYSKSVIQSVEFHPNSQMLLTAGFDRTLRLFQIDGKLNQMMQSVFYKDMPIYKASFSTTGGSIVASGRRKYFYTFDIEAGKVDKSQGIYGRQEKSLEKFVLSPCGSWIAFLGRDGYIVLVATNTKQWVRNLKMNGNVRAIAWSNDSTYLYSVGGDTEVYQWDVRTGKCLHRFADEGGFRPTCIAVSPNDQFFAVGSKSGIVNIYDRTCLSSSNPKALRAIGNLTTSIHTMRFNHDSQILAISSKGKKDQLRLVHIPSLKVFPNWPTKGTPLSYVSSLAFSPRSGYLAIGNDKGKVLLYRLNHYPSA